MHKEIQPKSNKNETGNLPKLSIRDMSEPASQLHKLGTLIVVGVLVAVWTSTD